MRLSPITKFGNKNIDNKPVKIINLFSDDKNTI